MHIEKVSRPKGRVVGLLSGVLLAMSLIPTARAYYDPIRLQPLPQAVQNVVWNIQELVCLNDPTPEGQLCAATYTEQVQHPCNWYPGWCEWLGVPNEAASELTGTQLIMAVGNIDPEDNPTPDDLAALSLLAYCQPYLDQFLGNTEYLGPLVDYGSCLNAGAYPAVWATVPQLPSVVSYLAGVCRLETRAYYTPYFWGYVGYPYYGNYSGPVVDFRGITDCRNGSTGSPFQPAVDATATLQNFQYPQQLAWAPLASGTSYAESAGVLTGAISPAATGGIARVQLETTIRPARNCIVSGVCGHKWVALPPKNTDTGTSLNCGEVPDNTNKFRCIFKGIPLTDDTIARR